MAKSINPLLEEIRSRPGAAERIESHKDAMRTAIHLARLREEVDATQVELATLMNTTQENVSRIERSTNPYLSTLAGYVGALGGTLEINAVFDDRVIPLAAVENAEETSA